MRIIFTTLTTLLLTLGIGVGAARELAQSQEAGVPFPLPEADGCWLGMCFAGMRPADVQQVVGQHPNVQLQDWNSGPGAYHLLLDDGQREVGLVLAVQEDFFALSWDWLVADNPVMLRLADAVRTLGAPQYMASRADGFHLFYPARRLELVIFPAALSGAGAWPPVVSLHPDAIIHLVLTIPPEITLWDGDPWRGFGNYVVR